MIKEEILNNMSKEELIQKIKDLEVQKDILEIEKNNLSNAYYSILHSLDNILKANNYRRIEPGVYNQSNGFRI